MKMLLIICMLGYVTASYSQDLNSKATQVKTVNGILQGTTESSGIHIFKGIPYAQPPVGELRWRAPQPIKNWSGVKLADHFGPRAMQVFKYSDMVFRSKKASEDCLYLNVWTPAISPKEKLPVMVYFYGGGFIAGGGSEYRYDGESMASKGIVTVTLNYRLGIFGGLSLPSLTQESATHSSGNYGLMDQHAALEWVHQNIAAFGGDPDKVTIAGESAGAMSVCAQMASPLSKGLFRGAIAESGSMLGNLSPKPLAVGERLGLNFMKEIGAKHISDLRAIPADSLLKLSSGKSFPVVVDGYFLPENPQQIFATGRQMDIPLLAGWNSAEVDCHSLFGEIEPTLANYKEILHKMYGNHAEDVLKAYPAANDAEVPTIATALASDRFIVYATWKFLDLHSKTDGYPVYRYLFSRKRPPAINNNDNHNAFGAVHASEIDYALGNLHYNKFYNWTADDEKVSEVMVTYFANFIKAGNPNGEGLPKWYGLQSSIPKVMVIDVNSHSKPEKYHNRYVLLDNIYQNKHR